MAQVKLEGMRKVFNEDTVAVANASFEVKDGEFVVLVGPSGCGKSTTLRMIAGLETVTDGRLYIGDRLVNNVPPKDRDIAMVFQNYALYPHMTAHENMAFGLKLRKYDKSEIDRRVHEAAEILSIEHILDRKPKALSGGQRQRVAVGRAIVRKPKVFLFDEPLSNLDAKLRSGMRAELLKIHRQLEATMIYVTHDQVEAMTMGDRIVVLRDGHIQQIDTPLTLYNRPVNQFVAGFIGSPSMNFVRGRVTRTDGDQCSFQAQNRAFSFLLKEESQHLKVYEKEEVILGIRPEHIYLFGSSKITNPTAKIQLQLEVVEPMGSEIVLNASYAQGEQQLVACVAPQTLPEPGEEVTLAIDLHKLHFFDTETGKTIEVQKEKSPVPR